MTGKKSLLLAFFSACPGFAVSDFLNCPCEVVKVIDGDTVHVLDQTKARYKIRLTGIDAPEKKQLYGEKSTQNLKSLIEGKNIEVEYNRRARDGLMVGKLIKNGQDINLMQLKRGYAWHYKFYQNEQSRLDRVLYSSAENEARKKTLGLWSTFAVPPWEFRKRH